MSCPCCPCRDCYSLGRGSLDAIRVDGGFVPVSLSVEPGVIIPNLISVRGIYNQNFKGDAYQWPCAFSNSPGFVALAGSSAGITLTIALSVTVSRLVMPIISLGRAPIDDEEEISVSWQFSSPFRIVSQGAHDFFGQCEAAGNCLSASGTTLTGREGSGIIEFDGPISSLTLSVGPQSEFWNAFGIGIPCNTNPLP